jgi:hypothetical protein
MAKIKTKATVKTASPVSGSSSGRSVVEKGLNLFPKGDGPILYDKFNYILMALGVLFIIAGFAFMAGGKNPDPNIFDAEAVYSFQRITLAPILVVIGLVIEIFAVLKRPSQEAS